MGAIRAGDYEEAVSRFAKGSQINPRHSLFYFFHAIALALAGRAELAKTSGRARAGARTRLPNSNFSEFGMASPIAEKFAEGARLLGLPE